MSRLQNFLGRIWSFFAYIPDPRTGKVIWSMMLDWFSATLMESVMGSLTILENDFKPVLEGVLEKAEATGKVPDTIKPILEAIKNPKKPIAAILGGAVGMTATGGIISSTIGPFLLLLQYEMQRLADQFRFDFMTGLAVLFRRPDKQALIWSDLRDQGITDERIELLLDVARMRLTEDLLGNLYARGEISVEVYNQRMYLLGYDAAEAQDYFKAREYYPTPQDLVMWQAREVFEPSMIAKYGLDSELENIQREPFYKARMTDEQIVNYWRAHWQHASWTQVQAMLFRGLIQESDVWDWFRLVEIPPFWRQLLIDSAYHPYTRVDVRRMHKIGVLDLTQVKKAYKDLGYNEEKAQGMTDFTEAYNQRADVETERALTKGDVTQAFNRETLNRTEAYDLLLDMGYGAEEANLILERAPTDELRRTRDLTLSHYRQLHERGLAPRSEIIMALDKLGYKPPAVNALLKIWDWEKPIEVREKERDLNLTQQRQLYDRGLRPRSVISQSLAGMGYDAAEITAIFEIWDWAQPVEISEKTRDLTLSNLRQLYQLGLRLRPEIHPLLAAMGYSNAEIDAQFELWDWEKPPATRLPSRTDYDRFLTAKVIDLPAWSAGYTALGYDMQFQEWYFAYLVETGKIE